MNTMTTAKWIAKCAALMGMVACGPVGADVDDTGTGEAPSATGGSAGDGGAGGSPVSTGGAAGEGGAGGPVDEPWEPKCPNGSYLTGGSHWLYVVDVWDQYSDHIPPGEYACVPVSPDELCVYRVPDGDADGASGGAWSYPQNPGACD